MCDNIASVFYALAFWPWGVWDLSSLTRGQPTLPALEGETLTTGLPREIPGFAF